MVPFELYPTPSLKPPALYPYPQNGIDVLANAVLRLADQVD
jgi:hypothetical protein